jgi:23S rRNA (adenine2030-N6)-methyltransferase
MNYQHAFHAGNFADVHKHVVLTRVLEHLRGKPTAFRVIDTHAGAGRYDLMGTEAARSGEWQDGIERLVDAAHTGRIAQALLAPYLDTVMALNRGGELRLYPGSPLIARAQLRPADHLIACETEPRAAALLKTCLRGDPRAKVLALDGWMALNANIPPKERRGLVLVDPPYEEAADFSRLSGALADANRKWPTGIYMLWYPIKLRDAPDALARRLRRLGLAKVLRCEITLAAPRADSGLVGSGLIVVNPPYTLAEELRTLLPELAPLFSRSAAYRLDWLAPQR